MAIAIRMAQATWEGPLASGTGLIRMDSGATGELPVTWASRHGIRRRGDERMSQRVGPKLVTSAGRLDRCRAKGSGLPFPVSVRHAGLATADTKPAYLRRPPVTADPGSACSAIQRASWTLEPRPSLLRMLVT
jgi:hypothetical protein